MRHLITALALLPWKPLVMKACLKFLRFWEIESVPTPLLVKSLSPEDVKCEKHFQETFSRDENGRFCVKLPFKSDELSFPGTFTIAKQALLRTEKRFRSNPALKESYHNFMRKYLELSHMSEIGNENSISSKVIGSSYFIPHHGIFQGNPAHPKFRVVFNASAKALN